MTNLRTMQKPLKNVPISIFGVLAFVAVTNRGTNSGLNIGNTDVQGHISKFKFRLEGIEVFRSFAYDFTSGLGSIGFDQANALNLFSLLVRLSPIENPIWLYHTVFVFFIGLIAAVKLNSAGALPGSTSISLMFAAIWFVVPSSLRVSFHTDFGGPNQAFVIVLGFLLTAMIPSSVLIGFSRRRTITFGLFLLWAIHGSSSSQPMLVWMLICFLLPIGVASLFPKLQEARFVTAKMPLLLLCCTVISALIAGAPVLTLVSTRRFQADSKTWGVFSDKAQFWVSLNIFGATKLVRCACLCLLIVALYFSWKVLAHSAKQIVRRFFGLLIGLQTYSVIFYFALWRFQMEIGPKPHYIAEAIGIPWLSIVVGLVGTSCLGRIFNGARLSAVKLSGRPDRVSSALVALPFIALLMWGFRNPEPFSIAFTRSRELQTHPHLAADWRLDGLTEARVLVIDRGSFITEEGFVWVSDFLNNTLSRSRPRDVIVYAEYSNGIPHWTSWVFEEFGSNSVKTYSSLVWAKTYNKGFVNVLRPTHILSQFPIDELGPELLDSLNPHRDGYLYRTNWTSGSLAIDDSVVLYQAPNAITATRDAFNGKGTSSFVTGNVNSSLMIKESVIQSVSIRPRKISIAVTSRGSGLVRFPIEFSNCHYLALDSNNKKSAKLVPLDGRFLGLSFDGAFQGEIRFRSFGPRVLECQFKDFLETRRLP